MTYNVLLMTLTNLKELFQHVSTFQN